MTSTHFRAGALACALLAPTAPFRSARWTGTGVAHVQLSAFDIGRPLSTRLSPRVPITADGLLDSASFP